MQGRDADVADGDQLNRAGLARRRLAPSGIGRRSECPRPAGRRTSGPGGRPCRRPSTPSRPAWSGRCPADRRPAPTAPSWTSRSIGPSARRVGRLALLVNVEHRLAGLRLFGHEQQRRQDDSLLGLEQQLLDPVAGPLDGVERLDLRLGQSSESADAGQLAHLGQDRPLVASSSRGFPRLGPSRRPTPSRSPRSGRRPSGRRAASITWPSGVHWYSFSESSLIGGSAIGWSLPSSQRDIQRAAPSRCSGVVVVAGVVLQDVDPFGEAQAGVEPLGVAEGVPGAADVEEVLGGGADQHRRRAPAS